MQARQIWMMLALSRDDISHSDFGLRLFFVFTFSFQFSFSSKRQNGWHIPSESSSWTLTKWTQLCVAITPTHPVHPPSLYIVIIITHTYTTVRLLVFCRFQAALKKYGVPEEEIFQTADLYERRNIPQVTLCLYALSRLVCSDVA